MSSQISKEHLLTFYPITYQGLSLLGFEGLQKVNPTYCMPEDVIERLRPKIKAEIIKE
jgi:prenyltransferase beta subunit